MDLMDTDWVNFIIYLRDICRVSKVKLQRIYTELSRACTHLLLIRSFSYGQANEYKTKFKIIKYKHDIDNLI